MYTIRHVGQSSKHEHIYAAVFYEMHKTQASGTYHISKIYIRSDLQIYYDLTYHIL